MSKRIDESIKYTDFDYLNSETLTHESRVYSNNTELLYRFPQKKKTLGLMLFFHNCNTTSKNWFTSIEEQRIIGNAIELGFGCLVFQPSNISTGCWSTKTPSTRNQDVEFVVHVLDEFYHEHSSLISLPRFTFGVSSGGLFSSIFVTNQHYQIHGQIICLGILVPSILYQYVHRNQYPATAWIHMVRDFELVTAQRLNMSMNIFIKEKVPAVLFTIEPSSITLNTFSQRIPSVNTKTSSFLYRTLMKNHMLNTHNYLIQNPRRSSALAKLFLDKDSLLDFDSEIKDNFIENYEKIFNFLCVAYGEHQLSYERSFEAFSWLIITSNISSVKSYLPNFAVRVGNAWRKN